MVPNRNKKNYRLADMTIEPDDCEAYPDPDESSEDLVEDRIDMAELGTRVSIREWRGRDGLVEQFALVLDVTPEHHAFRRCVENKPGGGEATQVRRTDTWHSEVHSHQYFIDCEDSDKIVHESLYGGKLMNQSRATVNAHFSKYYLEYTIYPFEYLNRWEAGKHG